MPSVITIGETLMEFIFRDKMPVMALAGGSTLNSAMSLARSGINTTHAGAVGNDKTAEVVISLLTANGIRTDFLQLVNNRQTPVSLAFLDPEGNAEYQFFRTNAPEIADFFFPEPVTHDILLMGSWFAADPANRNKLLPYLKLALEKKVLLIYDLNFRKNHQKDLEVCRNNIMENINLSHIIKASAEDLGIVFGTHDADEIYHRQFLAADKTLVVTAGADPVKMISKEFSLSIPCPEINPVSTIGAGDSFNAGIIKGLLMNNINTEGLHTVDKNTWAAILEMGIAFSQQVCFSLENYIPSPAS